MEIKMKIIEYAMLSEISIPDFDEAVNDFIQDGWELYGSTKIMIINNEVTFYQAMVKKTD